MFLNCYLLAAIIVLQPDWPIGKSLARDGHGASVARTTHAGLLITINPDLLVGEGLSRAWRQIDEPFNRLHIRSQPLSKVHFQLDPVPSDDGAVIEVKLEGATVGMTTSTGQRTEIVADSLTRFQANQTILLDVVGLAVSRPELEVKTNQSFHSAKAKKGAGFGAMFSKLAYNKFPKQVEARAKEFASRQILRHLQAAILSLEDSIQDNVFKFSQSRPMLANLGWHIFSDDRNVYLAAGDNMAAPTHERPHPAVPVVISASAKFVEDFARQNIGGKYFTGRQIATVCERFLERNQEAPTNGVAKPWSVEFADDPVEASFQDNRLDFRIAISKITIEQKQLKDIFLQANYMIEDSDGRLALVRNNELAIETNQAGARQRIVRTVVQKRATQFLPSRIELPQLQPTKSMKKMDIDLKIDRVIAENENIYVTIDHKR